MPRGDKTGPRGEGPMTGRGLGNCNPNNVPNGNINIPTAPYLPRSNNFGRGQGFGRGLGRGQGLGRRPVNNQ